MFAKTNISPGSIWLQLTCLYVAQLDNQPKVANFEKIASGEEILS